MAYWEKAPKHEISPQEPIVLGNGVNTNMTPFKIRTNEAMSSLNTSNRKYPSLSVRPGMTKEFGTKTVALTKVNALGTRAGTSIHVIDGTDWKVWNGTQWVTIEEDLEDANGQFVEFNTETDRYTVYMNGTDRKSYDGLSVVDLAQAPEAAICCVDDYKIYALAGSVLYCSATNTISDWTAIDDSLVLTITGMVGDGTAIAAFNDMVITWSDSTMHILYGNDPFDFQLMDPIKNGCVSNKSVIIKDGTLFFMDYNRFMAFGGGNPYNISQNVRKYLENINYDNKDLIVAGQWSKYVYLSIPYGTTATENNLTLEYDTEARKWYPWNVGFTDFVNMGESLYATDNDGVIWCLNTGTDDEGTAIAWEYVTGVWEGTPVMQKKVLTEIYMVVDLPTGSTLKVAYATTTEGTTFTDLYTAVASTDTQYARVKIPTTVLQNIDFYRLKFYGTGPCTIHVIEPHIRVKAR